MLSAQKANSPPVSGCSVTGIAYVWPAMMIASWSWVPASLVVTDASSAASAAGRLMRTTQLAGCWTGWLRAGCSATATPAVVNVTGLPSVWKQTPVGVLGELTGPVPLAAAVGRARPGERDRAGRALADRRPGVGQPGLQDDRRRQVARRGRRGRGRSQRERLAAAGHGEHQAGQGGAR